MASLFRAITALAIFLGGVLPKTVCAAELKGQVFKGDGTPAAGAVVLAGGLHFKPPLRVSTKADADGKFSMTLQALPDNWWRVHATWEDQSGKAGEEGLVSLPRKDSSVSVKIHLSPAGTLKGRLLHEEDDTPIAGASLFLDTGEVTVTDDAGRFEWHGLPTTDHSFIAVAPGVARRYTLFDTTQQKNAELEIRLPTAKAVRGQVLDASGNAIPGAYVTQPRSGTAHTLNGYDQACAADGSFVYDGIHLGETTFELEAGAPGYVGRRHAFQMQDEEAVSRYVFKLEREKKPAPIQAASKPPKAVPGRRNLAGTVRGPAGEALENVLVRWGVSAFEDTDRETRTDKEGRFILQDVPDHESAITVVSKVHAPAFVQVIQGEERVVVSLKKGPSVTGVVRNKQGKGIGGVRVTPVMPTPYSPTSSKYWVKDRSSHTDADGKFTIDSVPNEAVKFDFLCTGYSNLRDQELSLKGTSNEIKLTAGGALRGRVLDPSGKPVRNFRVCVKLPSDRWLQPMGGYFAGFENGIHFTRDDGTFVITDLTADRWVRLVAMAPGLGQAIQEKVITASLDDLPPAEDLTLKLTPPHQLRVRVGAADGSAPIANATVSLVDKEEGYDSESFQWGYTDEHSLTFRTMEDGWATCGELPMSAATVVLRCPGYARQRFGWRNDEKEFQRILLPEGVISGTITLDGKPIEECSLRLSSAGKESYQTILQPNHGGVFSFTELPPGEYHLVATETQRVGRGWRVLGQKDVVIKPGDHVELKIASSKPAP
jgi:hypothetical protein